jgi:hypothetical protein
MNLATASRWWAFARAFQLLPLPARKKVTHSRPLRSTYLRIARLHPHHGQTLDDMGAPLRVLSFVAWAPDRLALPRAAGQAARFEAVMGFYEQKRRWPRAGEFKGLVADIEEKWMGKPRPAPEKSEEPETGDDGPAPGAGADAPAADLPAALAASVAQQDPELARVLMAVAARRRRP